MTQTVSFMSRVFLIFTAFILTTTKKLRPKRNETKSTKLCDEYEVHSFNYKRIDIHCGAQFTNNIFLTLLRLFFLHQSRVLVYDHIIFLLTFPFNFFFFILFNIVALSTISLAISLSFFIY